MLWPSVTVVITTYDGREHLARCLVALDRLDYPRDRLKVIVVDNASQDGTVAMVAERFPTVRVIQSTSNLGFAAGSNRGFAEASTEFVVSLNNDVTVTPNWLAELVRPAIADPSVGLCTGKLLFAQDRLRIRLSRADAGPIPINPRPLAWLDDMSVQVERLGPLDLQSSSRPRYLANPPFHSPLPTGEGQGEGRSHSPSGFAAIDLGISVEPGTHLSTVRLKLVAPTGTVFDVAIDGVTLAPVSPDPDGFLHLTIPTTAVPRPVIQNAGVQVSRDGRSHDRGRIRDNTLLYYDDDRGQYDVGEEVFAGCGAGLLIRATLLADVGGFDERFFAYYEDVDLSWRARLGGWRVLYVPTAIARHVHRGSTAGWSDRFVYYTERNRLMMLLKCAPIGRALNQLIRASAAASIAVATTLFWRLRGQDSRSAQPIPRLAALASLARHFPALLADRARIQGSRRVSQAEIDPTFVRRA